MMDKSYITECHIQTRGGETIFRFNDDGSCVVMLHQYAIIPREVYDAMVPKKPAGDKVRLWELRSMEPDD